MKNIRLNRIALSLCLALGVAGRGVAAISNFNIAVSGNLVGACTASSTPAADSSNEPLVAGVKPQRQTSVGVTCAGSVFIFYYVCCVSWFLYVVWLERHWLV